MYIIGIDIGKNNHEASIVDPQGNLIGRSLRFSNTHIGAEKLMQYIAKHVPNEPCVFGMEATGHYWYSIYSFLKSKHFTVYVINPIQSNSIRSLFIRQTKNDSKDSFLIAEVIRFGQFTTTSLADENLLSMRQLCRYRDSLSLIAGQKSSSGFPPSWNKSSRNTRSSFLHYGATHQWVYWKLTSPLTKSPTLPLMDYSP